MSTKTGLKPFIITELISETHVNDGTIISFLLLILLIIFSKDMEIKFADDPELTNTEYFVPSHLDHFFSNSSTFFDCVNIALLLFKNFLTCKKSDLLKLLCINL